MAEDDLQFRIFLEHSADHQSHRLRGGLDRKSQCRTDKLRIGRGVVLVIRIDNRRIGKRRVHIDRHVERLCPLENRPELLLVEEFPIRQSVHHGALHIEASHDALKLVGRGRGIGCRQQAETRKTLRIGPDEFREMVVGLPRHPRCKFRRELLRSRRAVRQHLDVDTGFIHFSQPQLAHIEQATFDVGHALSFTAGKHGQEIGIPVMLLERDRREAFANCCS